MIDLLTMEQPAILRNDGIVPQEMEENLRAQLAQLNGAQLRTLLASIYDEHGGVN